MTQQSLSTVQNQVSTGLKVATAADNSSYWSIAAQLTADSGVVSASNDALSQGQSLLATASSAINSVITTINSIQTALTQATEPGANIGNINTSLASLGKQLTDAVNAASFNGLNVLNGSVASLNFVSGFNASATGGSINTISFTTQALYGLATGRRRRRSTSQSTVTDAATMSQLQTQLAADTADTTAVSYSTPTATYGNRRGLRGHDQPGPDGPVDGAGRHCDDDDLHGARRQRQFDRPGRQPRPSRRRRLMG